VDCVAPCLSLQLPSHLVRRAPSRRFFQLIDGIDLEESRDTPKDKLKPTDNKNTANAKTPARMPMPFIDGYNNFAGDFSHQQFSPQGFFGKGKAGWGKDGW